jgi:hypothetical protein
MDLAMLLRSLADPAPPAGASLALQALWWDAKGDWDQAHAAAQAENDAAGAAVHAYLHRKQGDLGNARYWYGRAGRQPAGGALQQEWETLARELLATRPAGDRSRRGS